MSQYNSRFEIIEDDPLPHKQKRKRKSKDRLSFNYMPWRLVIISLTAVMMVGISLIFFFTKSRSAGAPVVQNPDFSLPMNHVMGQIADISFHGSDMVAVSSDSIHIYKGSNPAYILNVESGSLSLSPDGTRLAALSNTNPLQHADDDALQIWDMESGNLLNQVPVDYDSPYSSFPGKKLAYSSVGRLLAVSTPGGITIRDAVTLEIRSAIPEDNVGTNTLVFSSDNQRLTAIVGYYDPIFARSTILVEIWDIQKSEAPKILYSLPIYANLAQYAALSADGHYLAYTSQDDTASTQNEIIHIHDLFEHQEVGTLWLGSSIDINTIALTNNKLAFIRWGVSTNGDQYSLQVFNWSGSGSTFNYQPLAEPQPLRQLGADNLRLSESSIEFLTRDTNTILHWDFASNTIRALAL